jgi:phosphoribosyl 1,2-cyclic phosphodiesterase
MFCFGGFRCILKGREAAIVKFCVLASGSSGNAALLATENTRILVDAGLSMKELGRRLALIGEDLARIDAILITHEHADHVSGLPVLARSKRMRACIYMTRLTAPAIDWGPTEPRLEPFQAGAGFMVGDIEVESFSIPHDAIDPVGYCFEAEGVRIGIATDLGYIPESIKFHLRRTDLLLLEANHDLDMLKVGPYPWDVRFPVRRPELFDGPPGAGPFERAEQPPGDRPDRREPGAGWARPGHASGDRRATQPVGSISILISS